MTNDSKVFAIRDDSCRSLDYKKYKWLCLESKNESCTGKFQVPGVKISHLLSALNHSSNAPGSGSDRASICKPTSIRSFSFEPFSCWFFYVLRKLSGWISLPNLLWWLVFQMFAEWDCSCNLHHEGWMFLLKAHWSGQSWKYRQPFCFLRRFSFFLFFGRLMCQIQTQGDLRNIKYGLNSNISSWQESGLCRCEC